MPSSVPSAMVGKVRTCRVKFMASIGMISLGLQNINEANGKNLAHEVQLSRNL